MAGRVAYGVGIEVIMGQPEVAVAVPGDMAQLRVHTDAWRRLHEVRLGDNVYLSPAFLGALVEAFGVRRQRVAFVYRAVSGERQLIGVLPLASCATGPYPFRTLPTGESPLLSEGTPLLHREHVGAAVAGIGQWLDANPGEGAFLCLQRMDLSDAGWGSVAAALGGARRSWVRAITHRPVLSRRKDFETYLGELSSKRRSGWRSARRRAGRLGTLEVRHQQDLADSPGLADRFLELEARGWKRARGTALVAMPETQTFLRMLVRRASNAGQLFAVEVLLDGRPISISINLREGTRLFGFKTAYEPAARSLAPGILNLVEVIRAMHQIPGIETFDTGAGPNSFVRPFCPEVRELGDVLVASSSFRAEATLRVLPAVQDLARRVLRRREVA